MPTFTTRRHVAFTPRQMYDLVADIETYPQFLPLCDGLTVLARGHDDQGRDVLTSQMRVGYGAFNERFTTRVTLDPYALAVLAKGNDGPFRHIENTWRLLPAADGGTDVEFFINYEFANPMLGMLVGSMFDRAFTKFADAFEQRAEAIYGRGATT